MSTAIDEGDFPAPGGADTAEEDKTKLQHKARNQMLAGGIAGSVGKTVTAPLSRLTILYQVSPLLAASTSSTTSAATLSSAVVSSSTHYPANLSLYSACTRIIREEGVWAFWRGNLTSVLHRFPYSAINFTTYESLKDVMSKRLGVEESTQSRLVCGALAGGVACFACYPLDLVRTRLTVSASKGASSSGNGGSSSGMRIVQTIQQVVREEGVRGLYRGLLVSLSVSVPNLAIGFSVYGTMKEKCLHSNHPLLVHHKRGSGSGNSEPGTGTLSPLGCMGSGAVSGILSSLVTFPADTVRRRMQVKGLVKQVVSSSGSRSSSLSESLRIVRAEGPLGLYRGILPELLKVTPMVGITFMVYESVVRAIEEGK